MAANVAAGLTYGPVGAVVAARPAVALVLSYELLMLVIRRAVPDAPASGTAVPEPPSGLNGHGHAADLRETDFGDWDGFTLEEIQQRWFKAAAAWRRDPEQAPPRGESFADTAHRVNRACDRMLRDHGGQTILVVSHVTPIKILLCKALGVPLSTLYRLYLGSACLNEIQWHGRGFAAVHRVNDTSTFPDSPGPSRLAAKCGPKQAGASGTGRSSPSFDAS